MVPRTDPITPKRMIRPFLTTTQLGTRGYRTRMSRRQGMIRDRVAVVMAPVRATNRSSLGTPAATPTGKDGKKIHITSQFKPHAQSKVYLQQGEFDRDPQWSIIRTSGSYKRCTVRLVQDILQHAKMMTYLSKYSAQRWCFFGMRRAMTGKTMVIAM